MSQESTIPYLTFSLAEERYAVPVERAAEVLEYAKITKLPMAEGSLRGIIDLRGTGIPVLDLRVELGVASSVPEESCSIIVLELPHDGKASLVGALVDTVYEVIEIPTSLIEPPPRFKARSGGAREPIAGIARADERFVIVLDADKLLDMKALSTAEEEAAEAV